MDVGGREAGGGHPGSVLEIAKGDVADLSLRERAASPGAAPRPVLVAEVHAELAKDPGFVSQVLAIAPLVARVRHPSVATLLDVAQRGDELLVVLEYAQVVGIGAALSRERSLPPRIACGWVVGALHGLQAAHDAQNEFGETMGLVHGGLTSASLFVGADGGARVVDLALGRAEATGAAASRRLPYLAPERARGGPATRQSDVWAAGVVLWELIAGRPLFKGADDAETTGNLLTADVPDLAASALGVPPPLAAAIRKALARAPSDRFATARAFALAIEGAIALPIPQEARTFLEGACGAELARVSEEARRVEAAARGPAGAGIVTSAEFIADALWAAPQPAVLGATVEMPLVTAPRPVPAAVAPTVRGAPVPFAPPPPAPRLAPSPTLDAAKPSPAPPIAKPVGRPRRSRSLRWAVVLGALVGLAVSGLLAGPLLVPRVAKDRAIAAAAARGVSLRIGDASGGYTGVHFDKLTATIPDVPGAGVAIDAADVDLVRFHPVEARLGPVKLSLDGPFAATLAKVTLWYRAHRATPGDSDADGLRIVAPGAELAWTRAWGDDGRIDATGISGEVSPKASARPGDELRFTTSSLFLRRGGRDGAGAAPRTIGPWRVDVEQDPNATTARVAFDPPVPDGPHAIVTRMTNGKTIVDVSVPRTRLDLLGLAPAELAAWGRAPDQIELRGHYAWGVDARVEASFAFGAYGAAIPPLPGRSEAHVSGSLEGDPRAPLDLAAGSLAVGPVKATLTGPVTLRDDGFAAKLAWKAAPIACADLLPRTGDAVSDLAARLGAAPGGGDLPSLGADVTALAQAAGLARASGTLAASGTLVFDSSDPGAVAFTLAGKNTCGIALVGAR